MKAVKKMNDEDNLTIEEYIHLLGSPTLFLTNERLEQLAREIVEILLEEGGSNE